MKRVKKIVAFLCGIRNIIPLLVMVKDEQLRRIIYSDMKRLHYECIYSIVESFSFFNYLMIYNICFRNVFYSRMKGKHIILFYISKIFLQEKKDLEIWGDIGEGLRVFHGHGTVLVCKRAGKNLDIYQGVTVGKNNTNDNEINIGTPTLGDNVSIYTNAVVVGDITIGDNVKIGAGAVITKSVPSNCTVINNKVLIINNEEK